jgi:hypothetical protein
MTIIAFISVILFLVSLVGLMLCEEKPESKKEELSNTRSDTTRSDIIIINFSFRDIRVEYTETDDLAIDVFNLPLDWKTIKPKKLVKMVIDWGQKNITYGKYRKITPVIKINYSKKGTYLGRYFFHTKLIEIFIRRHYSLESIVDTILHEYVHHLQLRNQKDDAKYDCNTRRVGYFYNPYEVEARELALKYRTKCIADLNLM